MQQLSQNGQQTIDDIARRHGFSTDAVLSMLQSVINGNGRMAQFNHQEFSGSGQWMSGGMTMVSDMFNNYLKGRVNSLCSELAQLAANQPDLLNSGSFQSQSQGGQQQQNGGAWNGNGAANPAASPSASLFIPPAPGTSNDWWGPTLRWPNSTGAQNSVRYAYFAQARRLAIELNGKVTIYETLDHKIGGFSQQQSQGGSISFNSQYGLIDVASLPVVALDGMAVNQPNGFAQAPAPIPNPPQNGAPEMQADVKFDANPKFDAKADAKADIFNMLDKLADLRSRDILSEAEFNTKKTELLARL